MSIYLLFPGPKCRWGGSEVGVQIAVAQHMDVNMCIWSTCISGGNVKQFQHM